MLLCNLRCRTFIPDKKLIVHLKIEIMAKKTYTALELKNMKVAALKDVAKDQEIENFSKMKKGELLDAVCEKLGLDLAAEEAAAAEAEAAANNTYSLSAKAELEGESRSINLEGADQLQAFVKELSTKDSETSKADITESSVVIAGKEHAVGAGPRAANKLCFLINKALNEPAQKDIDAIVKSDLPKSQKFRELYRLGVPAGNIAKMFEAHYSFVFNALGLLPDSVMPTPPAKPEKEEKPAEEKPKAKKPAAKKGAAKKGAAKKGAAKTAEKK